MEGQRRILDLCVDAGETLLANGADYTAEQVTAVAAGTVTAIADDALWGRVVEVTDAQDRV